MALWIARVSNSHLYKAEWDLKNSQFWEVTTGGLKEKFHFEGAWSHTFKLLGGANIPS